MNRHEALEALAKEIAVSYGVCRDCKHPLCIAQRQLAAIPETDREKAGRLLGEAWEKSGAEMLRVEPPMPRVTLGIYLPGELIADCEAYLAPRPLTDAEKLAKLRENVAHAMDGMEHTVGYHILVRALEATR